MLTLRAPRRFWYGLDRTVGPGFLITMDLLPGMGGQGNSSQPVSTRKPVGGGVEGVCRAPRPHFGGDGRGPLVKSRAVRAAPLLLTGPRRWPGGTSRIGDEDGSQVLEGQIVVKGNPLTCRRKWVSLRGGWVAHGGDTGVQGFQGAAFQVLEDGSWSSWIQEGYEDESWA